MAVVVVGLLLMGSIYLIAHRSQTGVRGVEVSPIRVAATYLAATSSGVIVMQWHDNDGVLTGTVTTETVRGTPPNLQVVSSTLAVNGVVSGNGATVAFGQYPQAYGPIANGTFTVNFPSVDGTVAPLVFKSASVAAYEAMRSALGERVSLQNRMTSSPGQLQAQQSMIDSEAATVAADLTALAGEESALAEVVPSLPTTFYADAQATKAASQRLITEAGTGSDHGAVCAGTSLVIGDAQRVAVDGKPVVALLGVQKDIDTLRSAITSLNESSSALQNEESTFVGYTTPTAPSPVDISQAVTTANDSAASAVGRTNAFVHAVDGSLSAAYRYVAQDFREGGCGTAPSAPAPLQVVT